MVAPQKKAQLGQHLVGCHPARPGCDRRLTVHPGEDLTTLWVESDDAGGAVEAGGLEMAKQTVNRLRPGPTVAVNPPGDQNRSGDRRPTVRQWGLLAHRSIPSHWQTGFVTSRGSRLIEPEDIGVWIPGSGWGWHSV